MAMLEYNEITVNKFIIFENQPYLVLDSHVFRKQQRKPVNATKLKNLITRNVKEISFHVSEKVEEAEIDKKDIKYLYTNRGEFWFCEINDPSKRFQLPESLLGDKAKFMKSNSTVTALMFGEQIIDIEMPIKVDLKVTEAHPAVKGDTAKGGNKQVTLETGAVINVPMFIQQGEILRINTETGEYVERVGANKF
ncbi:MAG: efp, elongation factor elongation factor [Candidatus Paceibacter sp.]|jgi:elongation factor P|nr:efp, elongation factor elongation factor [Candidatus Paceibacter sp.]